MGAGTSIDQDRLEHLMHSIVGDLGATLNAALVRVGDKLGLYRTLAGAGPLTPAQPAERTGTTERYIREWLAAQAAGGYLAYDAETGCYAMTPRTGGDARR
jgi:hypothetical protein